MEPSADGLQPSAVQRSDTLALHSGTLSKALAVYFARKGVEPFEIDDLVQEVFLRILKRGDSDQLEQFNGYVFTTAASVLTDRYRRRKARFFTKHVEFDPDLHSDVTVGPDVELADRDSLNRATRILMQLPERTRHVFILRRIEGMSYGEIAHRLGLSVSAIEKHMLRAARHLVAHRKAIG